MDLYCCRMSRLMCYRWSSVVEACCLLLRTIVDSLYPVLGNLKLRYSRSDPILQMVVTRRGHGVWTPILVDTLRIAVEEGQKFID
jgi:hypothetical protein